MATASGEERQPGRQKWEFRIQKFKYSVGGDRRPTSRISSTLPKIRFHYPSVFSTSRDSWSSKIGPAGLPHGGGETLPRYGRLGDALAAASARDTSAVTISLGKGSGNLANASGSGNSTIRWRILSCISFGVVQFILFSKFISFLVKIATMHRCGLREIGLWKSAFAMLSITFNNYFYSTYN